MYNIIVKNCNSTADTALRISKSMASISNSGKQVLKAGSKVRVVFDENNSIQKVYIINSSFESCVVTREPDGSFIAKRAEEELNKKLMKINFSADLDMSGGFFLTAEKNFATPKSIMSFIKLNSSFVDLNKRFAPGDKFSLLFERYFDSSGNFLFDGKLLYGSLQAKGKQNSFYLISNYEDREFFVNNNGEIILEQEDFFLHPLRHNARITSKFGMRIHPVTKIRKMHNGIDFAANYGSKIYASMNGVVEVRGFNEIYGNYIILNHKNGYKTLYAHLSSFEKNLKKNLFVQRGSVIGRVGRTGRATGHHLHYEVWRISPSGIVTKLNPVKYIEKATDKIKTIYSKQINITQEDLELEKNSIKLMFSMAPEASFAGY